MKTNDKEDATKEQDSNGSREIKHVCVSSAKMPRRYGEERNTCNERAI
jgi:hypothetical protein